MNNSMPYTGYFRSNNPKMKIISLALHQSGTFNDQMLRPYVTNVDGFSVSALKEVVENATTAIRPSMLGGVAGNLIKLSTQPTNSIYIPQGWGEMRMRFILIVESQSDLSENTLWHYFQGYTDHYGASSTGNLDLNMRFYVNSFITVSKVNMNTPMGMEYSTRVDKCTSVINPIVSNDNRSFNLIRPSDIFANMQTQHITNNVNLDMSIGQVFDPRVTAYQNNSYASNRNNSNSTNYISALLNANMNAYHGANINADIKDIYGEAIAQTADSSLSENIFIRHLSSIMSSPQAVTNFSLKELMEIDRDVEKKTNIIMPTRSMHKNMPNAGQGEYWNTQSFETVAAATIFNSLSAMMIELFITSIGLTSTNMTINGQPYTVPTYVLSPNTGDYSSSVNYLISRFENEVIRNITFNNQDSYSVEVNIDLFGASNINISINGNPFIYFNQASFADSLYQPIVTDNTFSRDSIVNDLDTVMNIVSSNQNNPNRDYEAQYKPVDYSQFIGRI